GPDHPQPGPRRNGGRDPYLRCRIRRVRQRRRGACDQVWWRRLLAPALRFRRDHMEKGLLLVNFGALQQASADIQKALNTMQGQLSQLDRDAGPLVATW